MKKVNFKVVLVALSFAFSFLFLGVNRVEAQQGQTTVGNGGSGAVTNPSSYGKGVFALPVGNFVGQQQAIARLDDAITNLKNLLVNMPLGSFQYNATYRMWVYYTLVRDAIAADSPVNAAIIIGLTKIAFAADSANVPTQQDLLTMRNAAVGLLQ